MTLRQLLDLYDNWNGYTQVNDRNADPYARVKTDRLTNGNYDKILDCDVVSFGFYDTVWQDGTVDHDFCVRIDYSVKDCLQKAKELVKKYFDEGCCGIFNTRNIAGDEMENLYSDGSFMVDICYDWQYFEVFGLSDEEFMELKNYYGELKQHQWDDYENDEEEEEEREVITE